MDRELKLDREAFLARYWQREPLLIPGAVPGFTPPVSSHELAGLGLEEEVEARIIEYTGETWRIQHGPFDEHDYRREHPWTLLVQAVDHYLPEVAELRKLVDFIPQWRVDDVMVSYAVDGGSVGPHYDNYDVFLLQGEGERQWKVGYFCDEEMPLLPHEELRILEHFNCQQEFLLARGDMLYLPPGVAHWGIARGECTTFSIGFRAPRLSEIVSRFTDNLLSQLRGDQFYRDAKLEIATRPGEIRPRDLERVSAQLQAALDQASGNHWFGELVTEPRYELLPDDDDLAEARASLGDGTRGVQLSPAAKLAWQREDDDLVVFANGESRCFDRDTLAVATALCGDCSLDANAVARAMAGKHTAELLDYLLETGCIYVD